MTSPGGGTPTAPDSGWQSTFNVADLFGTRLRQKFDQFADTQDCQNALNNRLDELNSVSGHCAAAMGRNWKVPINKWVQVPFTIQVGPPKNAAVSLEGSAVSGTLTLKKPGVWDIDVLTNVRGYTEQFVWGGLPSQFNPYPVDTYYYNPLAVEFEVAVVSAVTGNVITARRYQAQIGVAYMTSSLPDTRYQKPQSVSFTHSFVLAEFPTPPYPEYPYPDVYVGLSMRATATNAIFTTSVCEIYGGTAKSGLTASRWSKDIANVNYADTVPDGGTLT